MSSKIADGVHRIGNGTINAYLVEEGSEVTVIDAGVPGLWSELVRTLRGLGRAPEDVRAILLTHGHDDHIGYAERLRRLSKAPVRVHELDAALARGKAKNPASARVPYRLGPILSFFLYGLRYRYGLGPHLSEVVTFGDGATLDVPGSPRVIHLPGHTHGSAGILMTGRGALFMGDSLVTRSVATGQLGPQIGPFNADRGQALASLARLEGIEADLVLTGHGEPWTGGVQAAIALARDAEAQRRS
jgi:glyoxylase-like metal-dependent hydrolase (beta-lactamase superfamily II)